MCIVEVSIFSISVWPCSFLPALWQCRRQRHAGVCRSSQSLDEKFCWTSWPFIDRLTIMSLWLSSRHSVDLEFNEEVVKPERFIEAPDHTGFNPDTMRVSGWYQKTTSKGNVPHFSSFSRTSDTCFETYLTSERELIEDDDERLAMKIGDIPLQLPRRVSNPKIPDDQALNGFFSNSAKMHRATS